MKFKLSVFLFALFLSINLNAQNNASLKGKVTDAVSGDALPGANIVVSGTAIGDAADIYGNYILKNVPAGELTIKISYIGYKTIEAKVKTSPGKTTVADFKLNYMSIEGEEIIVTAQAKGQTEAINQQLASNAIVNVVSSARIQEIPDANAAESVGRLPGVSILRSGGEGNKVVIRGLAPKFNNVQVGGVKMASTDADDRSVDLSMISPYMLEGIEVTKAITPDMDADAIGGTVNFKLKEAQPGLKYDLLAQGSYNDLKATYDDYKFVASGSTRLYNDMLGVFAQADIERRNRSSNNMSSGYVLNSPQLYKNNTVYINSLGLNDINRIKNRYGATLVLDYRIPAGSLIMNNFISLSNTDVLNRGESYNIDDNTKDYDTYDYENKLNVMVNSLEYSQDFSLFKVNAMVSNSYSEAKTPDYISFTFEEANALNNVNRQTSPYDLPKYAKNNISNTFLTDIARSNSLSKDREVAGAVDLSRNVNLLEQLSALFKIGYKFNYKDRSYDYESKGGFVNSGSGQDARNAIINTFPWMKAAISSGSQNLPYALFIDNNYSPDEFLDGKYALGKGANVGLLHRVIDVLEGLGGNSEAYRYYDYSSNVSDYSGNEYSNAVFGMGDFQLGNYLKVITGVRYEEVRRVYTACSGNSTIGLSQVHYTHQDTTTTVTHSNLLPMIHIKFKPVEWFDVRFAYTNTLSRPDFTTITPKMNIGTESVTRNNYNLKPAHSENFDLYVSFHQNTLGLFTAGVFKKNIKDMIFASNGKVILDPAEYGLPSDNKLKNLYTYLNNDNPVDLWGLEFSWQTQFWYLPGFLKGFVLDINYTHINSTVKYPRSIVNSKFINQAPWIVQTETDTFYTDRMISQPNDIVNISLGYDIKGLSIRGSMLYQSNIFMATDFWPELRSSTDDFLRWDLSVKQELPWYNLQVYMNVTNISGEIDRNVIAGNGFPSSEQSYGTGIDLGVRYRIK
jgi:TonB-dependent receptor